MISAAVPCASESKSCEEEEDARATALLSTAVDAAFVAVLALVLLARTLFPLCRKKGLSSFPLPSSWEVARERFFNDGGGGGCRSGSRGGSGCATCCCSWGMALSSSSAAAVAAPAIIIFFVAVLFSRRKRRRLL